MSLFLCEAVDVDLYVGIDGGEGEGRGVGGVGGVETVGCLSGGGDAVAVAVGTRGAGAEFGPSAYVGG